MKRTMCIAAVITACFVIAIFAGSGEDTKFRGKGIQNPQLKSTTAQVPYVINYQGVLFDNDDQPVNGDRDLTFRLYDQESAAVEDAIWEDTYLSVHIVSGLFTVELSIPPSDFDNPDLWLGVQVDGGAELEPRLSITSVPYSYKTLSGDFTEVHIAANTPDMWIGEHPVHLRIGGSTEPADQLKIGFHTGTSQSPDKYAFIKANNLEWDGWDHVETMFPLSLNGGDLYISEWGKIGIGTTSPSSMLHIKASNPYVQFEDNDGGNKWIVGVMKGPMPNVVGEGFQIREEGETRLIIKEGGNVGIGTSSPQEKLDVDGKIRIRGASYSTIANYHEAGREILMLRAVDASSNGSGINLYGDGDGEYPGQMKFITGSTTSMSITKHGKVKCHNELQILGGSDIAEPFDFEEPNAIEPGMVVVIDPENPGKLKASDRAYDQCVAGIVSGAGGINPGLTLTQEDVFEGDHQVALTGRVYGLCDASYGPVEPGDLLTTSTTPGYAMKVTDYESAQGAILGKALTQRNEGQSLVLVLGSLQ